GRGRALLGLRRGLLVAAAGECDGERHSRNGELGVLHGFSGGCWGRSGADMVTPPSPGNRPRPDGRSRLAGYFCDRIHFTRAWTSASGTCALGGIGTWPQTPWPPFFTFSASLAWAPESLAYLAATSL